MVGKILWQNLKLLAEYDEAINTQQKSINALKEEQCIRDYDLEDLEEELFEKEQALHQGKKNVALQELYAQELEERCSDLRQKLKKVAHRKEFEALEKEINDLVHKQEQHDNVVVKSWDNRDQVVKQIDVLKKLIEAKAEEVKKGADAQREHLASLEQQVQEQLVKRNAALKGLSDEWIKRYERIKNTVKDPIVHVIQNCCGACFYLLASKDLVQLKESHIITCRNCYRFIYYDAPLAAPVTTL